MRGKWLVQVFGRRDTGNFEISLVREDNAHGRKSWGWFDHNKVLICHSGADRVTLMPQIWDAHIALAHDICDKMNAAEL